jgi:hypothetical protein
LIRCRVDHTVDALRKITSEGHDQARQQKSAHVPRKQLGFWPRLSLPHALRPQIDCEDLNNQLTG